MYLGKPLFVQVMDFLPWKTFHRIVDRYGGDHRTRSLSCAEQFRVRAFAQLTYRESLRDRDAVCCGASDAIDPKRTRHALGANGPHQFASPKILLIIILVGKASFDAGTKRLQV